MELALELEAEGREGKLYLVDSAPDFLKAMRVPTPPPPGHPGGIALSDSEKAEALTDNLEAQFQPVTDSSVLAVIEVVDVAPRFYFMTPASEPNLPNPEEV